MMFCPHEEVYINHDREAGEQMGNFEGGAGIYNRKDNISIAFAKLKMCCSSVVRAMA